MEFVWPYIDYFSLNNRGYFEDSLDKSCLGKTVLWTCKGAYFGAATGIINILTLYQSQPSLLRLQRVAFYTFPVAGMGAAAAVVSCALLNARKKDDVYNYVAGGLAAGSIWGRMFKSPVKGLRMGVILAILFAIRKHSVLYGWYLDPSAYFTRRQGFMNPNRYDFSVIKDPGPSVRRINDGLR